MIGKNGLICIRNIALGFIAFIQGGCNFLISEESSYQFEIIPEGEQDQIKDIARKTVDLQNKRADKIPDQRSTVLRGVHPKSHGCVTAEFTVNSDISTEYQEGLFSNPGKSHQALIRYSNAAVTLRSDLNRGNGSRGMAIKVFDVDGNVLVEDQGMQNQDFLMINTPMFAFPNVRSYQRLTDALMASGDGTDPGAALNPTLDRPDKDRENLKKTHEVLERIQSEAVSNPIEVQYFSAAPSRFGDGRAMKFSVSPCDVKRDQFISDTQRKDPNYLHSTLKDTMEENSFICLSFRTQVITSDQVREHRASASSEADLIEDATADWKFPFIELARISISGSHKLEANHETQLDCNKKAFNPWHALSSHQPLGGINRLRKPVYSFSEAARKVSD